MHVSCKYNSKIQTQHCCIYIIFVSLTAEMDVLQHIREKGLKATPARLKVIKFLENSHQAYSHAELETLFSKMDRVTLYRILNDFEEVGLLHKIIDIEGVTRFAVCKATCPF